MLLKFNSCEVMRKGNKKLQYIVLGHSILKKATGFSPYRSMKYCFVKSNEKLFPIDKMCKVLEVSSSN